MKNFYYIGSLLVYIHLIVVNTQINQAYKNYPNQALSCIQSFLKQISNVRTKAFCLLECSKYENCQWVSYDETNAKCDLFSEQINFAFTAKKDHHLFCKKNNKNCLQNDESILSKTKVRMNVTKFSDKSVGMIKFMEELIDHDQIFLFLYE
jgi:hypothetical protein